MNCGMDTIETPPTCAYNYFSYTRCQAGTFRAIKILIGTARVWVTSYVFNRKNNLLEDHNSDQMLLNYGIRRYGELISITGWNIAYHLSDFRIGLKLSRKFKLFCRFLAMFYIIGGITGVHISLKNLYGDDRIGLTKLESTFALYILEICETLRILYAGYLFNLFVLSWKFMYDFLFGYCKNITSSRELQRNTMTFLFIMDLIGNSISDPELIVYRVHWSMNHQSIPLLLFQCARLVFVLIGIFMTRIMIRYVPTIACFICVVIADHIDREIIMSLDKLANHKTNKQHQVQTPKPLIKAIIEKYGLQTITEDWPSSSASSPLTKPNSTEYYQRQNHPPKTQKLSPTHGSNRGDEFISRWTDFGYRRAIRILIEVRIAIRAFEAQMRSVPIMTIYMQSFLACSGIVVLFMQMRSKQADKILKNDDRYFEFRVVMSVIEFLLYHLVVFSLHQRLPNKLLELRYKLFAENLNQFRVFETRSNPDEAKDICVAWRFYDHISRLTKQTNMRLTTSSDFRLTGFTSILFNVVTFMVIYVQVIDVLASISARISP